MTGDMLMLMDFPHNVRGKISDYLVGNGGSSTFLLGMLAGIEAVTEHLGASVDGIWKSDAMALLIKSNYHLFFEEDMMRKDLQETKLKVQEAQREECFQRQHLNYVKEMNTSLERRNKYLETRHTEMMHALLKYQCNQVTPTLHSFRLGHSGVCNMMEMLRGIRRANIGPLRLIWYVRN